VEPQQMIAGSALYAIPDLETAQNSASRKSLRYIALFYVICFAQFA
jgi:hypothetical protein